MACVISAVCQSRGVAPAHHSNYRHKGRKDDTICSELKGGEVKNGNSHHYYVKSRHRFPGLWVYGTGSGGHRDGKGQ
ncbi:hypothetical protein AFLA_011956 [Aspergillus flavus NRRL3357]|nr:hypothetical protein AFLA_011956 [Aspergillus flavus NRRL3357]